MNYLIISPYFPQNFQNFAVRLKKHGVNVLGIGTETYDQLDQQLKDSLTEYYKVSSLENIEEVKKGVAFLFFKHGPIDRIESQDEYWLELDAQLREQFHVPGMKPRDLVKVKSKAKMKQYFEKTSVPVMKGKLVKTIKQMDKAIEELGLPIAAKPDNGVGTAQVFKLATEEDIEKFKEEWLASASQPYYFEQYVENGTLCALDGIIDQGGEIAFASSFTYRMPTLELIEQNEDSMYYAEKEADPKLMQYGQEIIKAFGIKERFFHIEFFRTPDGDYIALEYNNRPTGGYTLDLHNFAHAIDMYDMYARIVVGKELDQEPQLASTYCVGLSRRNGNDYVHSAEDIKAEFAGQVKLDTDMPNAFSTILGNKFFAISAETMEEIDNITDYVRKKV